MANLRHYEVIPKEIPEQPLPLRTVKISCWNIQGYNSTLVGNKFLDPDFTAQIGNSDIIGLSETHIFKEILDELDIPNFARHEYKIHKKIKNANHTSGGLAVLLRARSCK